MFDHHSHRSQHDPIIDDMDSILSSGIVNIATASVFLVTWHQRTMQIACNNQHWQVVIPWHPYPSTFAEIVLVVSSNLISSALQANVFFYVCVFPCISRFVCHFNRISTKWLCSIIAIHRIDPLIRPSHPIVNKFFNIVITSSNHLCFDSCVYN